VVWVCASPLSAAPTRKPGPKPAAKSPERADVFGGYSFVRAGSAHLNGWQVSASLPFRRSLSLVGDLSGHYGSFAGADLSQTELMVGARRYWHRHRIRPFAELLAGGVRHKASIVAGDTTLSSTGTDLGVSPGVGADYRLTRSWAARAAFDLLLVHGGGWETDPRLSVGAVYRFGQR
jgi:opacity protein-like surface antigen